MRGCIQHSNYTSHTSLRLAWWCCTTLHLSNLWGCALGQFVRQASSQDRDIESDFWKVKCRTNQNISKSKCLLCYLCRFAVFISFLLYQKPNTCFIAEKEMEYAVYLLPVVMQAPLRRHKRPSSDEVSFHFIQFHSVFYFYFIHCLVRLLSNNAMELTLTTYLAVKYMYVCVASLHLVERWNCELWVQCPVIYMALAMCRTLWYSWALTLVLSPCLKVCTSNTAFFSII